MNRLPIRLLGIAAISLWLMGPSLAAAQNKNKQAHNASAQEYNILNSTKEVRGKVAQVGSAGNSLTITVDTSHTEGKPGSTNPTIKPNGNGAQAEARDMARIQQDMVRLQQELAKLQQAEAQLAQAKNQKDAASKRAKVQQEINRVKQDYVKLERDIAQLKAQEIHDQRAFQQALAKYAKSNNHVVKEHLNFDLAIDDKAIVRKGSGAGTTADLAVGQEVHIYLTPDKSVAKGDGPRPTINKIIILNDGGNASLKNK